MSSDGTPGNATKMNFSDSFTIAGAVPISFLKKYNSQEYRLVAYLDL